MSTQEIEITRPEIESGGHEASDCPVACRLKAMFGSERVSVAPGRSLLTFPDCSERWLDHSPKLAQWIKLYDTGDETTPPVRLVVDTERGRIRLDGEEDA